MFRKIVEQSIKNGFFDEVTEDVLNDEEQFNTMVEVFLDEIIVFIFILGYEFPNDCRKFFSLICHLSISFNKT